jgi:hypothetical protein
MAMNWFTLIPSRRAILVTCSLSDLGSRRG